MEPPRSHLKRRFMEGGGDDDDVSNKPPMPKRVRFPKGKKVKQGDERVNLVEEQEPPTEVADPRVAAKERAKRRNQITAELFSEDSRGAANDISAAEITYEDDENFDEDGVQIEPFNLNKEREEGYFDADGNYVEYVNDKEIKDAWLDSVDVDPKYTGKISMASSNEEVPDLSSDDIGTMKRRIANLLQPGETVLKALRRLKGTNNRKEKMSPETKRQFDQLTEDSMKLMENGEYDVYHEKQEVFEREAEGYEKIARAKGKVTSMNTDLGDSEFSVGKGLFSEVADPGVSSLPDGSEGPSNPVVSTAEISSNDDAFDIFAEDEEHATNNPSSDGVSVPSSDAINADSETGALQNDYVYDESSGYYYSSSLGYYYDPSTGLYCSAASGQWYSFNEETGTYDEVKEAASNES